MSPVAPPIVPSVGRIVWYYPGDGDSLPSTAGEPLPGIVCRVWSNTLVNLAVFDANGNQHSRTSVYLVQPGQEPPRQSAYACWMPYQINKAAEAAR